MNSTRVSPAVLIAGIVAMSVGGCSAIDGGLDRACTDAISDYVGTEATITEDLETPGGSIDLRGEFDGGTFACAGSTESDEVLQALVYFDDGRVETVIL